MQVIIKDSSGEVVGDPITAGALTATAYTVTYATDGKDRTVDTGITGMSALADQAYALSYSYNNSFIPQNDLPLLNAEMAGIAVTAKMRRIAIEMKLFA